MYVRARMFDLRFVADGSEMKMMKSYLLEEEQMMKEQKPKLVRSVAVAPHGTTSRRCSFFCRAALPT